MAGKQCRFFHHWQCFLGLKSTTSRRTRTKSLFQTLPLLGYALLAIAIALFGIIISPVCATSPATDFTAPHLSSNSVNLQDLVHQGKVLYESGQLVEAVEVLQQAVQGYRVQGDKLKEAMTLSNLALVYRQMGRLSEATQAIADSLELLSTNPSSFTTHDANNRLQLLAQTLGIQGELQLELGQTEQALRTWQRAETLYTEIGDRNGMIQSRINQAQALQVLGFYRRALTTLSELSQMLQSQPDSLTKAVELRSLGDALQLVGESEQSRQVLQNSLNIAQQLQSPLEVGATLLSLGNTARVQQDTQAAIAFYQQAAEVTPSPLTKVQAQINQFDLLLDTEQQSAAQILASQILTELVTLPPSQVAVYAQIHFARSLIELGKRQLLAPDTVARLLATTIQQSRTLGDKRAESYALGTLGKLYEQTEQWSNARELTQQALILSQTMNAPDIAYRWHWQLGRLLRRQGEIAGAIAAYDAAVQELQSLRNDLVAVNRDIQFSFRDSVEPVYRESVELLLQSQATAPSEQTLDKVRQRIEALQLAELDDFFREACINATIVPLDKVVDRDNPTTAVIYPIILPNQLQVIVKIPQRSLRYHTVTRSQAEVESLLKQLRQSLNEPDTIAEVKSLSQQVYSWLIQPIESDLDSSGVKTLVFVLDGALRSVPMAALYDGKQYLVEKYAVALSLGLQLLAPQPLVEQSLQVLAAGLVQPPPNFQTFPPLPEIAAEFNFIARAGVPTTQLLNRDFTSKALESRINAAPFNVIHLATHGQFSSRAEDTFILAADGPINVTQFDTLLRRRGETRADAVELLVLSACQTAAGDSRATLGLAGVTVRAGARSTLASLWNVGDRSTAILIGEFYRELVNSKVTKAEALRRAQVALMKNYPNYSRPSFWAAYVLVGNWL
jgi:CHAT domain-containing protein